jgi:hypothetical protein
MFGASQAQGWQGVEGRAGPSLDSRVHEGAACGACWSFWITLSRMESRRALAPCDAEVTHGYGNSGVLAEPSVSCPPS